MNRIEATQMDNGNYYVEFDEDSAAWCVFGLNSGFAYSSWASEEQAEEHLAEMEYRHLAEMEYRPSDQ